MLQIIAWALLLGAVLNLTRIVRNTYRMMKEDSCDTNPYT